MNTAMEGIQRALLESPQAVCTKEVQMNKAVVLNTLGESPQAVIECTEEVQMNTAAQRIQ